MVYIMVTDAPGHWDKLKRSKTSFEPDKLKQPLPKDKIVENTYTYFVKINRKTGLPEKAWYGKVYKFEYIDEKLYFTVEIKKEIKVPDRYECFIIGWHTLDNDIV